MAFVNHPLEMMIQQRFVAGPADVIPAGHAVLGSNGRSERGPVQPLAVPAFLRRPNGFIKEAVGQHVISGGQSFAIDGWDNVLPE